MSDLKVNVNQPLLQQYEPHLQSAAKGLVGTLGNHPTTSPLEAIQYACESLQRAQVEADRILAASLRGKFDDLSPKDPLFHGMAVNGMPPLPGENATPEKSLRDAVEGYRKRQLAEKLKDKTMGDYDLTVGWLFSILDSNMPVRDVRAEDVRKFRDLLAALPSNFTKRKETKSLNAAEAAQIGVDLPKLAAKTQRKRFAVLTGLLRWAKNEGLIDDFPASEITVNAKSTTTKKRIPFKTEQLSQVFNCPIYSGRRSKAFYSRSGQFRTKDYFYWVPLIALFSGMRVGEILQLNKVDVREDNGIRYFDVTKWEDTQDELDKSIKSEAGERKVPIHSFLLDLGFWDYARSKEGDRVFPEVKLGSDGTYSQYFSKQWRSIGQAA